MLADVIAHPNWFWLTLGGLLLVAEMLGTNGYLLWSGISAVLIGLLSWLVPLPWAWQGGLFALVTLVTAWLWYCWMQRREKKQLPNTLNQRGNQMIGRQLTLQTALVNGIGHIQTGDSSWRVQADSDLPAGCEVTVVAIEGITLRIRPRS